MAKAALNFSKMDLAELLQLRDEIETALNGKIAMEREELQSKMAELTALERKRSKTVGREVGNLRSARARQLVGSANPTRSKGRS